MAGDRIKSVTRRDVLKTGSALTAAGAVGLYAPALIGQSKPLDGVTLNVSCWSAPYPQWLADYIPEFEDLTGASLIENIVSGQMSAAEAMRLAQESSISDLRRGGIKL